MSHHNKHVINHIVQTIEKRKAAQLFPRRTRPNKRHVVPTERSKRHRTGADDITESYDDSETASIRSLYSTTDNQNPLNIFVKVKSP